MAPRHDRCEGDQKIALASALSSHQVLSSQAPRMEAPNLLALRFSLLADCGHREDVKETCPYYICRIFRTWKSRLALSIWLMHMELIYRILLLDLWRTHGSALSRLLQHEEGIRYGRLLIQGCKDRVVTALSDPYLLNHTRVSTYLLRGSDSKRKLPINSRLRNPEIKCGLRVIKRMCLGLHSKPEYLKGGSDSSS